MQNTMEHRVWIFLVIASCWLDRCTIPVSCALPAIPQRRFACYGSVNASQLVPSCPSAVIAVQYVQAGVKPATVDCSSGHEDATCCTHEPDVDCMFAVPENQYYPMCSGRASCTAGVQQYRASDCGPHDTTEYPLYSSYLLMDYYCLPESNIEPMCTAVDRTVDPGSALYMWSPGYPALVAGTDPSCTCSVETDDCGASITVYTVHVDLGTDGDGACQQTLEARDGDGTLQSGWACSNGTHYVISADDVAATYLHVQFTNNMADSAAGVFWIGFQSTSPSDGLRLNCPAEPRPRCTETTTSVTTTPSTTTSTTTATTTTPKTSTHRSTTVATTTTPLSSTVATTMHPTTMSDSTTATKTNPWSTTARSSITTTEPAATEGFNVYQHGRDDVNIILAVCVCSATLLLAIAVGFGYVVCCRKQYQRSDEEKPTRTNKQSMEKNIPLTENTPRTKHDMALEHDSAKTGDGYLKWELPVGTVQPNTRNVHDGKYNEANTRNTISTVAAGTERPELLTPRMRTEQEAGRAENTIERHAVVDAPFIRSVLPTIAVAPSNKSRKPSIQLSGIVTSHTNMPKDGVQRTESAATVYKKEKPNGDNVMNKGVSIKSEKSVQIPAKLLHGNPVGVDSLPPLRKKKTNGEKVINKAGRMKDDKSVQTPAKLFHRTSIGVDSLPPMINEQRTSNGRVNSKTITETSTVRVDTGVTSDDTSATLTSEYSDEVTTASRYNNQRRMAIQEKYKAQLLDKTDVSGIVKDESCDVKDIELIKTELSEFMATSKSSKSRNENPRLMKRMKPEDNDIEDAIRYDKMFRTVARAFFDTGRRPKRRRKRKIRKQNDRVSKSVLSSTAKENMETE